MGRLDEANDYFFQVEEIIKELQGNEKVGVLWNLANSCRRTHNFEKEYHYLDKIVEMNHNDVNNDLKSRVLNRLSLLNMHMKIERGGELDYSSLERIENEIKIMKFYNNGKRLLNSFQFENAQEWFKRAYDVNEDMFSLKMMGMCNYLNSSYDPANEYFSRVLSNDPNDIESYLYSAVVEIIKGNKDEGLSKISEAFNYIIKNNMDYRNILTEFVKYIIFYEFQIDYHSIVDKFTEIIPESFETSVFLNDLGTIFTDLGFFDEGIKYYTQALKYVKKSDAHALILNNIGTSYTNQNRNDEAIEYYIKALKQKKDYYQCWNNMASSYAYQLNFEEAIRCINEAINYAPQYIKMPLEKQKTFFKSLNENIINLNNIDEEEISNILYSAEIMLLKLFGEEETLDYSFVLVQYSKALEIILHSNISTIFKEKVIETYGDHIPDKYMGKLHDSFKGLIRLNRTLSLGSWCIALDKLNSPTNTPIMDIFNNYIKDNYSKDEIDMIRNACCRINDLRNASAHREVKSLTDVIDVRTEIIIFFNKIINVFYQ